MLIENTQNRKRDSTIRYLIHNNYYYAEGIFEIEARNIKCT